MINRFTAIFSAPGVVWINQRTFGAAFTSRSVASCWSSMPLSSSISDSLCTSQSSSLLFGFSKLPFPSSRLLYPNHFPVHYPHHFRLDCGQFHWSLRHWILEFILKTALAQIQLVGEVIIPTMKMQQHHYIGRVTRVLCWSPQYLKCILQLSSACLVSKIHSVQHVGFGCPATSPKCLGPWPFCATSVPQSVSWFPKHFHHSAYLMLGHHVPISNYWRQWTALWWLSNKWSDLSILTSSSR